MSTEIVTTFTQSAEEELAQLAKELRLGKIIKQLHDSGDISPELRADVRDLAILLADMFGSSVPTYDGDPFETMRAASRDINVSRILRERGVFRLYRLIHSTVPVKDGDETIDVPVYAGLINPDTGEPFNRQEEFIMWFCREAHVARATVFQRIATIDRMLHLGADIDEAYRALIGRSYAVYQALGEVGTWSKGELISVNPTTARRLVERVTPEAAEEARELSDAATNTAIPEEAQQHAREKLKELVKPAMLGLVDEVVNHDSVRDALDFVRHDIADRPEIRYYWNQEQDYLEIEYVKKVRDLKGMEYVSEILTIPMIPDVPALPKAVRDDLQKRLPIRNRDINIT